MDDLKTLLLVKAFANQTLENSLSHIYNPRLNSQVEVSGKKTLKKKISIYM